MDFNRGFRASGHGEKPRPLAAGSAPSKFLHAVPGRPTFHDAMAETNRREANAEIRGLSAHERHRLFMSWRVDRPRDAPKEPPAMKTDLHILHENHRFVRNDKDNDGSWEARLAQKYYARLYKEYVLADLAGYKKGLVGFRWRTEAEVIQGKGQLKCGNKKCDKWKHMRSYEVVFQYKEAGEKKRTMVKVRLCPKCAYRLNYKHMKKAKKRKKREAKEAKRERKRSKSERPSPRVKEEPLSPRRVPDVPPPEDVSSDEESAPSEPEEDDQRELERLAWSGPAQDEAPTRQEEFDSFFDGLIL